VLAAQNAFIVQGGAFTTKDAASGAANEAKGKGAPAQTLTMNNREFMFLGVTDSIETAKQMEGHYEANGFDDVLPKQISIAEKTVSDINDTEKDFSYLKLLPTRLFLEVYHQKLVKKSQGLVINSVNQQTS
jgi:stage II sporulation protein B